MNHFVFLKRRPFDSVCFVLLLWVVMTFSGQRDSFGSETDSTGAIEPATSVEVYGQGVRESQWQTPQQELEGFHLAPGFEARLFASEPLIAKPMNLAFDSRGRLWVTQTIEYPYPAKEGSVPRDAVMILEDTDGDGRADKSIQFADGLNIPIGLLPYGDGCLCFSIPNLLYLRDTNGDGTCDQREVILGPFDTTRDTHGMVNALRDGGDGWIYACHGFNNQSQLAGRDGHQVTMHSGNTFRFRPDGSRVEHVTHGQVNPFGMTQDEWGYRYTADCHSKPITQLVMGAFYPSFGRPHDGLGFLPPMLDHLHGSTAICGLVSYPSNSAILPLRQQMLSGNVMTSRINRNRVTYQGATAKGIEMADFMTSDDPWFRPVDLQRGPDESLYVADFYNKIIGHYEVPLTHPDRDRDSGRIWQIRYLGPKDTNSKTGRADPIEAIRAMRGKFQRGEVSTSHLVDLIQGDSDRLSVAAIELAKERIAAGKDQETQLTNEARQALNHRNAHVVRAAAELLGWHGQSTDVPLLLSRLEAVPEDDVVLRQTIRIALRNLFSQADADDEVWQISQNTFLPSILLGLRRREVVDVILRFLIEFPGADDRDELLSHAVSLAAEENIDDCVRVAKVLTEGLPDQGEAMMVLLLDSIGPLSKVSQDFRNWVREHVDARLQRVMDQDQILGWSTADQAIWPLESRRRADGGLLEIASSLGRGESYTGSRISDAFSAPKVIRFWLAGHNGWPEKADHGKNRVRLIRVRDGVILNQVTPPRNDVAMLVEWDLRDCQGQLVRIECVDGDHATAFAWLGVGGFEPVWLDQSDHTQWLQGSLDLIKRLNLTEKSKTLETLMLMESLSVEQRLNVGGTLASLRNASEVAITLQFASTVNLPIQKLNHLLSIEFVRDGVGLNEMVEAICQRMSQRQQTQFADGWAGSGASIDSLLSLSERGLLSPAVLASQDVYQTLQPRLSSDQNSRLAALTEGLNLDDALNAKLVQLQSEVQLVGFNLEKGRVLYQKHCANCHQLAGEGQVVGPQLDGAASRSMERLLEDVVVPDRNIDQAFRTTSFLLDDGRVVTGLVISESDDEIKLADPTGKPLRVLPQQVETRQKAGRSLMPSNFAEVMTADDLRHLLSYIKKETGVENSE